MKYGYLVVEGPHDVECVGRLLKLKNIKRVRLLEKLSPYWRRNGLASWNFPIKGDLLRRIPVPTFFQNEEYSIAVHNVGGYTKIPSTLNDTVKNIDDFYTEIAGIGIIADADYHDNGAYHRFHELKDALGDSTEWPEEPGKVTNGKPKRGIFIFPNNNDNGTLETVLLKCAQQVYPGILDGAENFVNRVNIDKLPRKDSKDFIKPSGKDKAKAGSIATILRPGKAIQVSIQDNNWISEQTIHLPEINALNQFLIDLLEFS